MRNVVCFCKPLILCKPRGFWLLMVINSQKNMNPFPIYNRTKNTAKIIRKKKVRDHDGLVYFARQRSTLKKLVITTFE